MRRLWPLGFLALAAGCASPLTQAARDGDHTKLAELIHSGARLERVDSNGETPLMKCAIQSDEAQSAKMLLDAGADPNHATLFGSPLDYAVRFKRPRITALLLQRGARPTAKTLKNAQEQQWAEGERLIAEALEGKLPEAPPEAPAVQPAAARAADESQPAPRIDTVSDVDFPKYESAAKDDDYAVVVGVEIYPGLPAALYAERDARAMHAHLRALGIPERNIFLLTGASASRAGIAKNLETRLPNLVNQRSTVFFYYSGHGAPDPRTGEAYLLPVDGDPKFLDDTAYPLSRLYQRLDALKAKRVIVALDACFSGAGGRSVLAKGARPLVTKAQPVPQSSSGKIVALAASGGDEISGTDDEHGHGLFTYYLLKGLNEGKRSAKELYQFLKPRVQDAARRDNRDQTPVMTGPDAPL